MVGPSQKLIADMVAAQLAMIAFAWSFTMDDAFISFRYAKHIGEGVGPVWNLADVSQPVEGFTSFLHVWVLGLVYGASSVNLALLSKALGVASALVLTLLVVSAARQSRLSGWPAAVALSPLALPYLALHSASGMETALFMPLAFCCGLTCLRALDYADALSAGLRVDWPPQHEVSDRFVDRYWDTLRPWVFN